MLGHVPAFSMLDQAGKPVTDESLQGEVLVVDFFYASCTTACPRLTGRMLAVEDAIASREARAGQRLPVHLVSITLDPANDSPSVLAAYAERVGADPLRWSFLSGRSEDLNRVVVSGFNYSFERAERADPAAGIGAIMHGEWLVLVDAKGSLRGYYAASDSERMSALPEDAACLALAAGGPEGAPSAPSPQPESAPRPQVAPKTYHVVGVVRSFGPSRSFVNIAHEDIPGYMAAMTMSFEPKAPGQLDGLAENDRVQFDFVETADARRVLAQIDKQR